MLDLYKNESMYVLATVIDGMINKKSDHFEIWLDTRMLLHEGLNR